jgi:hypothetical protein
MTLLAVSAGVADLAAQTPKEAVQTVLARLAPNKQLPTDLILTGQVTDAVSTQPFRITTKGKDQVRYEIGTTPTLVTTTQTKGSGWTETGKKVTLLQPYAAVRRPALVPFLDLLAEADNQRLQVTDRGTFSIGNVLTRRFTLKLPDLTPDVRLFRRPLDEETDVYVDPASSLVVRAESWIAADNNPDAKARNVWEFADYQTVAGFTIPFQIRNTVLIPGQPARPRVYVVTTAIVNSGVPDSTFTAPEPKK